MLRFISGASAVLLLGFSLIPPALAGAQSSGVDQLWASPDTSFHEGSRRIERTFTIDVSLDTSTLVINHVDPTAGPMDQFRGDSLVIDGSIFRGGTLPTATPAMPMADNDPNSPENKIGHIRCRATSLIPSSDVTTPGASFVTEMYSLPDDNQIILVDGLGANLFATMHRVVFGGTGLFEGVTGEVTETNLGMNKTGGCNLRLTFHIAGTR